jgi:hypothetical protein
MGEVTECLHAADQGDSTALPRVFDVRYPELHKLAGARFLAGADTLNPTALVHESYLRLVEILQKHLRLQNLLLRTRNICRPFVAVFGNHDRIVS